MTVTAAQSHNNTACLLLHIKCLCGLLWFPNFGSLSHIITYILPKLLKVNVKELEHSQLQQNINDCDTGGVRTMQLVITVLYNHTLTVGVIHRKQRNLHYHLHMQETGGVSQPSF